MAQLDISITSWHSLEGNFEYYHVDYLVDKGKVDYLSGGTAPRRFAGNFVSGKEITNYFLSEYNFSGKDKPKVAVNLWHGFHPKENCPLGCLHARYTMKPEESLLKELSDIL
jgi:hypothetical protein